MRKRCASVATLVIALFATGCSYLGSAKGFEAADLRR